MHGKNSRRFSFWGLFLGLMLALLAGARAGASEPSVPLAAAPASHAAAESDRIGSGLEGVTREAIREWRDAADAGARRETEALGARLNQVEQALARQRERELEAMQTTNRTVLIGITVLVTLGVLGTAIMGIFMFRSVSRMVETATALSPPLLPPAAAPLDRPGAPHLLAAPAMQQSTERVLGAIGRLQKRIEELEHTAPASLPAFHNARVETASASSAVPAETPMVRRPGLRRAPSATERVALLFEKGDAHLHLDQAREAVSCFDELLACQPDHAGAHLKRGAALEKLERYEEALASYERATRLDPSLATAYLCQGGLFHRLERYDEALRCYDAALRAGKDSRVVAG